MWYQKNLCQLLCLILVLPLLTRADPSCVKPQTIPLEGKSCAALRSPDIGCHPWPDVEGALRQENLNTVQRAADLFSWQNFLALNWPLGEERGVPSSSKTFAADGPRVWESWKEAFEIYRPKGAKPAPWNAAEPIPKACEGAHKLLLRTAKVDDVVDEVLQALPADGTLPVTLKDQQGRLLRYEIRLNRVLFDAITDPAVKLYNGESQIRASQVDFPVGSRLIKAAWRPVTDSSAPFFQTADACVCDKTDSGEPDDCRVEKMGLAGLHIMTKTASAPQWIWSTFEQVDNVGSIHPPVQPLNDPDCPPDVCPPNRQTPGNEPNQVERVTPIPDADPNCSQPGQARDNVAELNREVQQSLAKLDSVFRYYQLVGTQWPKPVSGQTSTTFNAIPALLANATMETFAQDTSSCMGCHSMARTLRPDRFVSADFSFTLNNAQPRPTGSYCENVEASVSCSDTILPAPNKPANKWEKDHWPQILHGRQVATRTYELIKAPEVRASLHCSSCHLNGGGNPDAAWWVGMWKDYEYPATTKLQQRINRCFQHSLNGQPICSTENGAKDCEENPAMNGLIAYMKWLTNAFYRRTPQGEPARRYPSKLHGGGDYQRGEQIYRQKCSFCHNTDGQGRYQSDTYFRPALWGEHSFNACAGMAETDKLASFVRWNMPYTSGGLLTDGEARDVAAFITAQCRPGMKTGPEGGACPKVATSCNTNSDVKSEKTASP